MAGNVDPDDPRKLTDFKLLSFDVHSTLIDEKGAFLTSLITSFAITAMKHIRWDAVYTAQRIGSYKPDLRNFEFLIEHMGQDLGVKKEEVLHTAQSLRADHVPAKKMNMTGVWIDRENEGQDYEKLKDEVAYTWKFSTLGEMADAVEEAFEAQEKKV
ncbi:hypothetical protein BPOR_0276g00060 [Botrytis porri]|uniref:Uncharacterized protein n=1 Tax=Botrytis porri TaxID=87229 RepID=A0A4Z1KL59_9HELO|nr:hypothetical protein BPOR_0276g00060 [Botrytis porri]